MPLKNKRPLKYFCILSLLIVLFTCHKPSHAQDSLWTLERCKEYARKNNLTIQQSILNERLASLQLQQSKLEVLPNISLSVNYGANFGRSIEPTTNEFVTTSYDFNGFSGSSNVLLFGWFQKRNQIAKSKFVQQAANYRLSQVNDDIILNLTNAYLRVLLAADQLLISLKQIEFSLAQLDRTRKLFSAGKSNGLDLSQVKTQLLTDSSIYFKAQLGYQQSILDIKVILDLKFEDLFIPIPESFDQTKESRLIGNTEELFNEALNNSSEILYHSYQIKSHQKNLAIAKASLYPQLNLGVAAGTTYSSTFREYTSNGTYFKVPWDRQIRNNFNQSIYLGLSIPIFTGLKGRLNIQQVKVNIENAKLSEREAQVRLKQEIYRAVNEVNTAVLTLRTAEAAVQTAKTGVDFAQKRYEKGLINAFEMLQAQTALFRAEMEEVSAKYDLQFKSIVIDYYRGIGK